MGEVVLGVGFFCGPTLLYAGLILAAHRSKRHVRDQLLVPAVLFNFPTWLLGLSYARLGPSDFIHIVIVFSGALVALWAWLRPHGAEPSTPVKMLLGILLVAIAYEVLSLYFPIDLDFIHIVIAFPGALVALWAWLRAHGAEPSTPVKMLLGIPLVAIAFGVLSLFFFPIGAVFVLLVWPVIGVVVAVRTYRLA